LVERIDGNAGEQPLNGSINPRDRTSVLFLYASIGAPSIASVEAFLCLNNWIHMQRLLDLEHGSSSF
jgi:hypothetical protein